MIQVSLLAFKVFIRFGFEGILGIPGGGGAENVSTEQCEVRHLTNLQSKWSFFFFHSGLRSVL